MTDSPLLVTFAFPDLSAAQAVDKVRALREFATNQIPDLQFVKDEREGHLGVGLTFAVMIGVPAARLLWGKFFSEFHPREPDKVLVQVDGKTVFQGYAADPAVFPDIAK